MTAPKNSTLHDRLARVRASIAAGPQPLTPTPTPQPPPAPPPTTAARQHPPPPPPKAKVAAKATHAPPAKTKPRKADTATAKGKAAQGRAPNMSLSDREAAIVTELRRQATRPEMAALVTDEELLAVWKQMTAGAAQAGTAGVSDRAALGRALGLPLAQVGGVGAAKGGRAGGIEVRDRLMRSVSAARGHAQVTRRSEPAESDYETAA